MVQHIMTKVQKGVFCPKYACSDLLKTGPGTPRCVGEEEVARARAVLYPSALNISKWLRDFRIVALAAQLCLLLCQAGVLSEQARMTRRRA